MLYALSWFAVLTLLTLWSLGVWALQAFAVWTVSSPGAVIGTGSSIEGLRLPDWLTPWVPPEVSRALNAMLSSLGPAVESLLQGVPEMAGGVTMAAWVVWGLGSVALLLLGAGLHVLIAFARRGSGRPGPQPAHGMGLA